MALILLDLSLVWVLIVQAGSMGRKAVFVKDDDVTVHNARVLWWNISPSLNGCSPTIV